jgi:dTDP-4-dehydrorhamnose 3,5-epimerase
MTIIETPLNGVILFKPKVFNDARGYFLEGYNKKNLSDFGIKEEFVQDNISCSGKHVLRGLHFQNPPYAQGKLVRVIKGAAMDVIIDIRTGSPTYGQSYSVELTGDNHQTLWIPAGFAHGFITLSEETIFFYKCTNYYNKDSEGTLLWNDPDLNINWGIENPIISDKDAIGTPFNSFKSLF